MLTRSPLPDTALRLAAIADERAQPRALARYGRGFLVVHALGASYAETTTIDKARTRAPMAKSGERESEAPIEMYAIPLTHRSGAGVGRAANVITIGRLEQNDVFFGDDSVSKLHALIRDDGDAYYIADAGSKNGTIVDGERVGRMSEGGERKLVGGEMVQLGNITAMFVDTQGLLIVAGALQ